MTNSAAMMSMRVDPRERAVLTYGTVSAGVARNIIPERAELRGVIRGFSESTIDEVEELARTGAEGVATSHGVTVKVNVRKDTVPPTVTSGGELEKLRAIVGDAVGELDEPLAIAEDFSWILRQVPGVFLLVGASTGDPATSPSNHSANATYDDSVLAPHCRSGRPLGARPARH